MASIKLSGLPANLPPLILSDMVRSAERGFGRRAAQSIAGAIAAALYTAIGACAISVGASQADPAALRQALAGDMRRLIVHEEPRPVPGIEIADATGAAVSLEDFEGSAVILNFWATWCAPCRKEMPSLDRLQQAFDSADLMVLATAMGRNPVEQVQEFLEESGLEALAVLYDEKMALSGKMGIVSIPVTVLINRNGDEVARFIGDTEWDSDDSVSVVEALVKDG